MSPGVDKRFDKLSILLLSGYCGPPGEALMACKGDWHLIVPPPTLCFLLVLHPGLYYVQARRVHMGVYFFYTDGCVYIASPYTFTHGCVTLSHVMMCIL